MNRREEREHKFRLLFSALFYPEEEIPEQLDHYFESPDYETEGGKVKLEELKQEDRERLEFEVKKIIEKIPELDREINQDIEGWTTQRMNRSDLTVLRLALYEIHYDDSVPEKVALNEAVDLAKKYGGTESGSFVNGVLARIVNPDRKKEAVKTVSDSPKAASEIKEEVHGGKSVHILVNRGHNAHS